MSIFRGMLVILFCIVGIQGNSQNCYIDSTNKFIKQDFSNVWLNETFQGTIGNENKRIQMRIISIHKDKTGNYSLSGKSKVGNNVCDFKGTFSIIRIELNDQNNPLCESPDNPFGKIVCSYQFYEDSSQNFVGLFSGTLNAWFDYKNNFITKTDGWSERAGNSTFIGRWQEYGHKESKFCSFASKIPPSFRVDLFKHSENEFYMFNAKYLDKGWRTYVLANLNIFISVPKIFESKEVRNSSDYFNFEKEEIEISILIEKEEWWI